MSNTTKKLLEHAEECLNSGHTAQAAVYLEQINIEKIPRADLWRVAHLFRRAGANELALRLLLPVIRPEGKAKRKASAHEIAEGAICLYRAGAVEEASDFLDLVDPKDAPEALLYRTIVRFSTWDFRGGISNLLQLLNLSERDSYLYRLTQLNLATAFVFEESWEEAEILLSELRHSTSERGELALFLNTLEISIQVAVYTGHFTYADECLTQAEHLWKSGTATRGAGWVGKWRAILDAFMQKSVAPLAALRESAARRNHGETLRELDYLACRISLDQKTLRRLYFGTQYPAYRRRLARYFPMPSEERADFHAGAVYTAHTADSLNLFKDLTGDLRAGSKTHKLLVLLIADPYRVWRTGHVHSHLFPGTPFHPDQALKRVHQEMRRLQSALQEQIPGLRLVHDDGCFRLDSSRLVRAIEIPRDFPAGSPAKKPSKKHA